MPAPRHSHDIPASPPPEVLAEIDMAWERASELAADGLDLHIAVGRISGRVRAELRIDDVVAAKLSPGELLSLACGAPVVVPPRD